MVYDRDKLRSELSLHITGNMFDGGGDGVASHERGVHDYTKAFYLQVSLVQGFEGTAIIEVMIEWDGEVGVSDCSSEGGVFSGGWE